MGAVPSQATGVWERPLPWKETGLSEHQAAAHLLRRLAFGPRPGDIDRVLEMGLTNWIEWQLGGDFPGTVAEARLARLEALSLSSDEILERHYQRKDILEEAIAAGVIKREDYLSSDTRREALMQIETFANARGYLSNDDLYRQLLAQKLLRAVYSETQLVEVLTDFWLNHFHVSSQNPLARLHLLSYERDAIRPAVLGSFRQLLGATARHPAMLLYLDNAESVAATDVTTTFDLKMEGEDFSPGQNPSLRARLAWELGWRGRRPYSSTREGVNENYARELLELHTLGVDGGYTQADVLAVARAFTGWATFPLGEKRPRLRRLLADAARLGEEMGFVIDGEFLFRSDHHDAEPKTVLGHRLAAGRGIEDGEDVLDLVAGHPATARRVAYKLAIRFVSDEPPEALVSRLAEAFELTRGDLRELMRILVSAPEFWRPLSRGHKVKSPFEFAVSALRAMDAELTDTTALAEWIHRMGQPLYAYGAPTGYPDHAETWSQVGPILARLNFAAELARGHLRGVVVDLTELADGQEPGSLAEALRIYGPLLLPEIDTAEVLRHILEEESQLVAEDREGATEARARAPKTKQPVDGYSAYAAAILIGSPEFQKR